MIVSIHNVSARTHEAIIESGDHSVVVYARSPLWCLFKGVAKVLYRRLRNAF